MVNPSASLPSILQIILQDAQASESTISLFSREQAKNYGLPEFDAIKN